MIYIQYIKSTLQNPENLFEAAILHMGIKDLQKSVTNNIINVANQCKNYGIKNIFVSDLTINNRLHLDFIKAANNDLKLDCVKYGYNFMENSNILPDNLWQYGLHLSNSGKGELLNYFLVSLNKNYFLSKPFIQ